MRRPATLAVSLLAVLALVLFCGGPPATSETAATATQEDLDIRTYMPVAFKSDPPLPPPKPPQRGVTTIYNDGERTSFQFSTRSVIDGLGGDIWYTSEGGMYGFGSLPSGRVLAGTGTWPSYPDYRPLEDYNPAPRTWYWFNEGFFGRSLSSLVGSVWFVRTHGDVAYAKLKVVEATAQRVKFEWVYQPNGSTDFQSLSIERGPQVSTFVADDLGWRDASNVSMQPGTRRLWLGDRVVNTDTGTVMCWLQHDGGKAVFSPDGSRAYLRIDGGQRLVIVDASDCSTILLGPTLTSNYVNPVIDISPDGQEVYLPAHYYSQADGRYYGEILFASAATGELLHTLDLSSAGVGYLVDFSVNAARNELYAVDGVVDQVVVVDLATRTVIDYIPTFRWPSSVEVSVSGDRILVTPWGGTAPDGKSYCLQVFNASTRANIDNIAPGPAFNPGCKGIAVTSYPNRVFVLTHSAFLEINLARGRVMNIIPRSGQHTVGLSGIANSDLEISSAYDRLVAPEALSSPNRLIVSVVNLNTYYASAAPTWLEASVEMPVEVAAGNEPVWLEPQGEVRGQTEGSR